MRHKLSLTLIAIFSLFVFFSCSTDEVLNSNEENNNNPPIAVVGSDRDASIGVTVSLDGSSSHDPDNDSLSYEWEFLSKPNESQSQLSNSKSSISNFVPDKRGSYEVKLTVSDQNASDEASLSVTADIMVLSSVNENIILSDVISEPNVADYAVSGICDVNAKLTIEPGVVIEFGSGGRMDIEKDGALKAIGSSDNHIIFTGATKSPGSWEGIRFVGNNPENEISHVEVIYGGQDNYSNISIKYNGGTKINHTLSKNSATYGLSAENGADLREFSYNTFSNNSMASLEIPANLIGSLDENSDYLGEAGDVSFVSVVADDVEENQEWPAINSPYVMNGITNIKSKVRVNPGAIFQFNAGARLDIEGNNGALIAKGKPDSIIKFLGNQEIAGYWEGIRFQTNNPENELTYTKISHGGANNYSNVIVTYNGSVKITNSDFAMSETYGLDVNSSGVISEFSNNEFDSDASVHIPANMIGSLDSKSSYLGDDGSGNISVSADDIKKNQTWPAADAPFLMSDITDIQAAVTIQPGAKFVFNQGARIDIEGDNGALIAIGKPDSIIKFWGNQKVAGYWEGIRFQTNNPSNELTYTEISHGGANGYSNIVVAYNGSVKITNSTVTTNQNYGLSVDYSGLITEFANNNFASDAIVQIPASLMGVIDANSDFGTDGYISVRGNDVETDQTWKNIGAPFRIDGIVDIFADVSISPGAILEFTSTSRLDIESGTTDGSLKAMGTSTDSIKFIGTMDIQGHWSGLNFGTKSTNNLLEYCVISNGGASGYPNVGVKYNGGVTVNNSTIKNSSTFGVRIASGGTFEENNNTYSNNQQGNISTP